MYRPPTCVLLTVVLFWTASAQAEIVRQEFAVPAGAGPHDVAPAPVSGDRPRAYAVYVDDRDVVWVSDFAANAMLRFDPETERFETFENPRMSANVRQIHGRPGEVRTPESGTDRLAVFRTE